MYRFLEILPGALAWLTLVLIFVLSRYAPAFTAIFIILFDVYWLLKTIYLSFHLRSTFNTMRENQKINWLSKLKEDKNLEWGNIYHLVIFPFYKEPYEIVRESFESIAKANYPKDKFIVVLTIEERAGEEGRKIGERIEKEFGSQFFKFLLTYHPSDLPGEIPGKGSNETWAGRKVKELIIDPLKIPYQDILVSVFDVDTQVFHDYFGRLTYVFLHAEDRLHAIYQPIPLFTNNIHQAPAFARVVSFSSTFWQMMQQSRPERLTSFSSQSLPFSVLADIGFWHTDVVSEDSRIFWQGFLHYHGNFRCEPLFYPVSMDANVAPSFWETMINTYKQHRRWGWGAENIPYALDGFRKDPLIPRGKKWYWSWNKIEGFHSWATNAIMIFALGWLPVILGGQAFNDTLLSYNLPNITRTIIELSMVGIATSAILSLFLLRPMPKWFGPYHYVLYLFQWLLTPVTLIIFGCVPALEAQTRLMLGGKFRLGFWVTPKSRKSPA